MLRTGEPFGTCGVFLYRAKVYGGVAHGCGVFVINVYKILNEPCAGSYAFGAVTIGAPL